MEQFFDLRKPVTYHPDMTRNAALMVRDALAGSDRSTATVRHALATMEEDFNELLDIWCRCAPGPAVGELGASVTERALACDLLRFLIAANNLIDTVPDEVIEGVADEVEYLRHTAVFTGDWAWAERCVHDIVAAIHEDD